MTYILHYAPDNASLIVRLALDHCGLAFETCLVDRTARAQDSAAYRKLNPHGLIPTLETPHGPLFETGAILLWLADTHGGLGPAQTDPARGDFLKWLFYTSNTLHPALRRLFYPENYTDADGTTALRKAARGEIHRGFSALDAVAASAPGWFAAPNPTALDFYVAALLRWPALYPSDTDRGWYGIAAYPHLHAMCAHLETLPCSAALQHAEGMGTTPFTAPTPCIPPEGSAT